MVTFCMPILIQRFLVLIISKSRNLDSTVKVQHGRRGLSEYNVHTVVSEEGVQSSEGSTLLTNYLDYNSVLNLLS